MNMQLQKHASRWTRVRTLAALLYFLYFDCCFVNRAEEGINDYKVMTKNTKANVINNNFCSIFYFSSPASPA